MNISAVNFNKTEKADVSVNVLGNKNSAQVTQSRQLFEKVMVGAPMTATRMDEVGRSNLLGELESVKEQLQVSASSAKDSLKALFKKMDGSTPVIMDEDGYDLNNMDAKELVTVVERIQIRLATYCEEYRGSLVDVDAAKIEAVTGSVANVSAIQDKLTGAGLAATKENVREVTDALEMASQATEPDYEQRMALVAKDEPIGIEDMFKAKYVLQGNVTSISDKEWDMLKDQVKDIIVEAGMEPDKKNYETARAFVERQIPVTAAKLQLYEQLESGEIFNALSDTEALLDRIVSHMATGGSAKSASPCDMPVLDKAKEFVTTLATVSYDDVAQGVFEGKAFTISELKASYMAAGYNYQLTQASVTVAVGRFEQLNEAKMLLSASSFVQLTKLGIDVYNTPVDKLVEDVKARELALPQYESVQQAQQVYDIRKAVFDLSNSPIQLVGEAFKNNLNPTLEEVASYTSFNQKVKSYQMTYEAVGTQVRKDLKDSLFKAVEASSESILNDLGQEDNELNRSTVRILAANNIDIDAENFKQVKQLYVQVKRLVDNMKPDVALQMIKDGINPMNTDLNTLNAYLENMESTTNEKFSRFLYKLDRHKEISGKEREQFIGIYKMMNIFTRDAGKAAGALYAQGAEFNMSNLIAAYNGAKAAGKDIRIDDSTGLAEIEGAVRYFDNLFSMMGNRITPATLEASARKSPVDAKNVESFLEEIDNLYDENVEAADLEGYVRELSQRADISSRNMEYLLDRQQEVTLDNIMAIHEMLTYEGKSYDSLRRITTRFKAVADSESLKKAFGEAKEDADEEVAEALDREGIDYHTFEALRMAGKRIHLSSSLAKRNDYHIPYEDNGGIGIIHLQVQDGEEKGKASVRVSRPNDKSAVMVEITVQNNTLSLSALGSNDKEYVKGLLDRVAQSQTIQDMGFDEVRVMAGYSDIVPSARLETQESEVKTSTLFNIAKEVITQLGIKA